MKMKGFDKKMFQYLNDWYECLEYKYAVLDMGFDEKAEKHNDEIFRAENVLGIDVGRVDLVERCNLGNVDSQYIGQQDLVAIEAIMSLDLPPDNAVIVTAICDLNLIGAMAVMDLMAQDCNIVGSDKIVLIAQADKFTKGKAMRIKQNLCSVENISASEMKKLAVMSEFVREFSIPIETKVLAMKNWLLNGSEPDEYRKKIEKAVCGP